LPTRTTHVITRSRVVAAAPSRVRLCLGVLARDRTVPHRTNRPTRALRANSSRPARSVVFGRSGHLSWGLFPFSTRRPRRALFPKAAGPRTYPAAAFRLAFRPRLGRDLGRRAFALAVFRFVGEIITRRRSGRRTVGVGRSIVANVSHGSAPPVTLSSIEKTRSPVVFRSAARVGSVKPTRLRASRSRRTRRSERFSLHAALISPPGPGHAPTRPLARCSATRCTRSVARPCRTRGPSLYVIGRPTDQSVAFAPATRCLVRRRSWGSDPSQV